MSIMPSAKAGNEMPDTASVMPSLSGQRLRQTADSGLTASLNQEIADRKAADATGLSTAKAYTDAQTQTEAAARIAADNTLQGNISSEAAARVAGDTTLQNGLVAEAARAQAAESALAASLSSETARARAAESSLTAQVTQEIGDRKAGDSSTLASIPFYRAFMKYAEDCGGYKSAWEL